jgi:hypothetical protein
MMVVEVDIVESTVDIFTESHTCNNITNLVDNDLIVLYARCALNASALLSKRTGKSLLTTICDLNHIVVLQVTKTVVALVTVPLVAESQRKEVLLTSDTTPR